MFDPLTGTDGITPADPPMSEVTRLPGVEALQPTRNDRAGTIGR